MGQDYWALRLAFVVSVYPNFPQNPNTSFNMLSFVRVIWRYQYLYTLINNHSDFDTICSRLLQWSWVWVFERKPEPKPEPDPDPDAEPKACSISIPERVMSCFLLSFFVGGFGSKQDRMKIGELRNFWRKKSLQRNRNRLRKTKLLL